MATDTLLVFTEEQMEGLITSIFSSVNGRIGDRIIQTLSGGDDSHTVSAEALEKYLSDMKNTITTNYTEAFTNVLKNYTKTSDLNETLKAYVTLSVLNQMLENYPTKDSLSDVVRQGNLGSTDLSSVLSAYLKSSDFNNTISQYVKTNDMNTELAKKQNKLSGSNGQIVGFDSSGNAVPQAMPSTKPGYLYNFTKGNWVKGSLVQTVDSDHSVALYDYTITIPAATHGLSGSSVTANFSHKVNNVYRQNTWACIGSYATIANNVITLHYTASESDAGYEGQVQLFVM